MPIEVPDSGEIEMRATEALVGDASLRDEMTDDEAQPLIDWGLAQIVAIAQNAQAHAAGDIAGAEIANVEMAAEDPVDAALGDLRKLMKRVNRFIGRRASREPERIVKDLNRMSKVSSRLFGDAVSPPDAAQIDAFVAEQNALSNQQVVARLLAMFAPPETE